MRIVCISDIHGNLPALEAVLRHARTLSPDLICSLGDQIGFGPQPREVLALLEREEIPCLLGNHELRQNDYLLRRDLALETDVNFAIVRHIQTLIDDKPFRLPRSHQIEEITFAHAAPDDPVTHLDTPDDLERALARTPTRYLVCGHQHMQLAYHLDGRSLHIVGSAGMPENALPGTAQFTQVDIVRGGVQVTPHTISYDASSIRDAFVRNGFAQVCPIMSRLCCEAMLYHRNILSPFFRHAFALKKQRGDETLTLECWRAAADTFAWLTDGSWTDYWK